MQRLWNRMATLMFYLGIDTVLVLNDAIHTLAPYHITDDGTNNVEDSLTLKFLICPSMLVNARSYCNPF